MKAQGLALGLVLLLAGCATNTSGVALYGAAGAAAVAEQHQNVNVTLTELSRRQQNGLLQVNVAAASTSVVTTGCNISSTGMTTRGRRWPAMAAAGPPQVAWLPDPHPVRPGAEPGRPGLPDLRSRSDGGIY